MRTLSTKEAGEVSGGIPLLIPFIIAEVSLAAATYKIAKRIDEYQESTTENTGESQ